MRWILIALLASAGAAHAQTAAAARPHAHHTLTERFDEANTTHDGHLTAEQARSKMPAVARDFDSIDTTHKGYVTVDDIKGYRHAKRLARRAEKQGAQPAAARAQ